MLNTMRDNLKALSWLLWVVVASFVIAIFANWGRAGDAARADATANWVAKVNGETIPASAFQSRLRRIDGYFRQVYRDQYDPRALGIVQMALNQLVREKLILDDARRVGLRVSDAEVSRQITENPSFQKDGRFIGVSEYQTFLRARGIDVASYEADLAQTLLSEKYQHLMTDAVAVSEAEVEADYRRRNEKVTAEYLVLPTDPFLTSEPVDEAALRAYFDEHPTDYMSPERRRAAYTLVDPNQIADVPTVTEEEARAYYDDNLDRLYSTPEQVRASHILIKVPEGATPEQEAEARARAQGLLDRVRAGESFADLAEKFSEDDTNAKLGGDLGFFPRDRMVAPFSDVAFSLPIDGVSDLVRTQFGFHIIKVTGRREASTRPFAEVREPIIRQLQFSRSQEALREKVAALRAAVEADPAELDQAAARLGLEVHDTGIVAEGAAIPEIGDFPQVTQALFHTEVGQVSRPVTLPQGTLFLRVTEVLPPQRMSFEEARAAVEADLRADQALEAARRKAAEASAKASGFADLAKRLGVKVETTSAFTRLQPAAPFTPTARDLAFQLAPGEISEGLETEDGLLIFQVKTREGYDPAEFAQRREALERSLLQQRRDRLFSAIVDRLEKDSTIQRNQARLALYEGNGA